MKIRTTIMKKFKVIMKRTYVTTTEVEVEANDKEEAHDIVLYDLGDVDIHMLEDLEVADIQDEIFDIEEIDL